MSITHRDHFVNVARRRALEANEFASRHRKADDGYESDGAKQNSSFPSGCTGGFFADQFENLANFRAHYECTGPEIWDQTDGQLDAFVAAAGTGGTLAGVSRFLQVYFFSLPLLFFNYASKMVLKFLVTCSTGKESKHQMLPG